MGWTYSTIDGLNVQQLSTTVQSELIRAVNERRECVGLDPVEFLCGDGTATATYPAAADFDGFPLLGVEAPISTPLATNLYALITQIKTLAPLYFITTSTGTTNYSVSTLESAVGLGAFQTSQYQIANMRNPVTWQRIMDALNLLVYVRVFPGVTDVDGVKPMYTMGNDEDFTLLAQLEVAWDSAKIGQSWSESNVGFNRNMPVMWSASLGGSPAAGRVYVASSAYVNLATSIYSGIVTREYVPYTLWTGRMASAVDFDVGGETVSSSINLGGLTIATGAVEPSGVFKAGIDTRLEVSVSTSPPASHPFYVADLPTAFSSLASVQISLIGSPTFFEYSGYSAQPSMNLDLSTVLTDQQ